MPVANAPVKGPPGYIARHADILKPLLIGLAGALITASQIFHWDVGSIVAVVAWVRVITDMLHG